MTGAPVETQRAEDAATRRIRVGALGLACVFLLVMLATALLRATSDAELVNQEANVSVNAAEPAEPLAQLGVAPGNAPDEPVKPAPPPVRLPAQAPTTSH